MRPLDTSDRAGTRPSRRHSHRRWGTQVHRRSLGSFRNRIGRLGRAGAALLLVLGLASALAPIIQAVTSAPADAAPNLIENGSFESPAVTPCSDAYNCPGQGFEDLTPANNPIIPGWTIGGVGIDLNNNHWQAEDGVQSVDLAGNGPGSVSQTVTTVAGETYTLSWWMAGNPDDPGNGYLIKTMDVYWGGATPVADPSFNTAGHTDASMGWVEEQVNLTATSTSTTVEFADASAGATGYGATLDNVSLTPMDTTDCASSSSFSDDFATDTSLSDCWETGTPLLQTVATRVDGATSIAPDLAFNGTDMDMQGAEANPEFTAIQSSTAYEAPFDFKTTVQAAQSGDNSFVIYLTNASGGNGFSVEGNLSSTGFNGIWVSGTVGAGSDIGGGVMGQQILSNQPLGTTFHISMSIDDDGDIGITVNGTTITSNTLGRVGNGPFFVVLGQRESDDDNMGSNPTGPVTGANEAAWYSASLTTNNCSSSAFSTDFSLDYALSSVDVGNLGSTCWQAEQSPSSDIPSTFASVETAIGATDEPPNLTFESSPGSLFSPMQMAGTNGDNQFTGIQSATAYSSPFELQTSVEGLVSNGSAFAVYLVDATTTEAFTLEGDLNPTDSNYGIWANSGIGASAARQIMPVLSPNTPGTGVTYNITMAVDSAGDGTATVSYSGGSDTVSVGHVGTGPFYVILGQHEGTPVTPGPNEANWYSASLAPALATVSTTLSANSPTVDGVESVPASAISATTVDSSSGASSADAASIPLSSIPLSSIGLAASPLSSIPLSSIPLSSIAVPGAAPPTALVAAQQALSSSLLSDISIEYPAGCGAASAPACTGWAGVLAGSQYADVPLESVTLAEVLADTTPGTVNGNSVNSPATNLETVDLGDLNLSSSPLSSIPLSSIALGATTLSSIPIDGTTSGSDALQAWCQELTTLNSSCTDFGISESDASSGDDNGVTLLALALAGVPLSSIPLSSIPLSSIPLSSIPLSSIPLSSINLASNPLSSIPLSSIPLSSIPLSSIPLSSIFLSSIPLSSIPLSSIPLSSIPLFTNSYVNCGDVSCTTGTLGQAEAAGAVSPDATLGELGSYGDETIGDLPASAIEATTPQTTVGQLLIGDTTSAPSYPSLTLADLLLTTVPPTSYPWPNVSLANLPLAANAASSASETDTYTATVDVSGAQSAVQVTLNLPPTFSYVAGTTTLDGRPAPDPVGTSNLKWTFVLTPGTHTLMVEAAAGIGLGPAGATLSAAIDGLTMSTSATDVEVKDGEEPDNTPALATPLTPGTPPSANGNLNVGYLTNAGDLNDWSVTVPQGDELAVALTNLPATYDLELFGPSSAGLQGTPADDLTGVSDSLPTETPGSTTEATPGSQDLATSPPAGYELEAVSNNPDGQSQYLQTPPLAGGTYLVQVSGYNGDYSPQPYLLQANLLGGATAPSCLPAGSSSGSGIVYPNNLPNAGSGPATIPSGFTTILPPGAATNPSPSTNINTLFIVDTQRLGAAFGGDETTILNDIQSVATDAAAGVTGAIVPVDAYATVQSAYANWNANPCSVDLANDVVAAISGVIDQIRSTYPTVQNLVIVGADDQIPFARIADGASESNERDYGAATFAGENNVEADALSLGYYFSDDPYAASSPLGVGSSTLYLPQLAVGRLVESASEIEGALTRFTNSKGDLDATSSLTTGYSFLTSGADAVEANLASDGLHATCDLISESWTTPDLDSSLAGDSNCPAPGVDSINAHFDYSRGLPAIDNTDSTNTDLFTTTDVSDLSPFPGQLLFSMGCHAGLDIDDAEVSASGIPTPVADWAKTFADAGALWLANTGYGYADTDTLAYSAKLMAEFAGQLNGTLNIGEALTAAKQQYAAGNAILSPYDLKALMESTFYGLPMYHLNTTPVPTNGTTTLLQSAPTSGTTNTPGTFSDQLYVSGATGAVTYTQITGSPDLTIDGSGAVSTLANLAVGTYTATGTDADGSGDTGNWTYTLSVTPQTGSVSAAGIAIAPVTFSLPIGSGAGDLGVVSNANGTYYQVNGAPGGGTQTTEYRPIEPLVSVPVTELGLVPHGALVTGLSSQDFSDILPAYSMPAVGSDDATPPAIGDAAFPGTLQRVASLGTFTSTGTSQAAELDLVAGQFFPNPSSTTGLGTERLFTSMSAQVYYDTPGNALASDYTPAIIDSSQATGVGGAFNFNIQTTPSSASDPVGEVVVLYTDASSPGIWTEVTLGSTDNENWTGTSTSSSSKIQYIVEAVDAAGNVAVSNNEGVDFNALTETTTSLSTSANPASVSAPVTFTAAVSPDSGTGIPTGSVEFLDGGGPIAACGGSTGAALNGRNATCTVTYTSTGDHEITADYLGDSNFATSQSSPENLTVSTATSATSLSMSVPSASYGDEQAVTFTSEVASTVGTPSGTVVVASGATTLCTITLPAISCSTTNPTVLGASTTPYSITATYGGGGGLGESTSGPQILTVDPAGSTTTISVSSSPVTYGNERTVAFTAGVTAQYGGTPTGTISVEAGTTPLCAITLPSTSCSASPVALDAATSPYAIQAFYSGDSNFADSTSGPESLTISKDTTTASVAESPTTVRYGGESASSFTVTVNTGNGEVLPEADSVTVNVGSGGSVASCSASVAPGGTGGSGSCTIASAALPTASAYPITATYPGDADLDAAAQATAPTGLTVNAATTNTTVVSTTGSPSIVGQPVTYTATVGVTAPGSGTPSGVVEFFDSGTAISACTAQPLNGSAQDTATCMVSYSTTGTHTITAQYLGSSNFAASAVSGSIKQQVNGDPSTATLSLSKSSVTYGAEAGETFTATVTGTSGSLPTGTVSIKAGSTTLCSTTTLIEKTASSVTATCSLTYVAEPAGSYTVTAVYSGDTHNAGSTSSPPQSLTVNQDSTTTVLQGLPLTVTYGSEQKAVFGVAVLTGDGEALPAKEPVTVTAGTASCVASMSPSPLGAIGSCSIAGAALPVGSYKVTASYVGDTDLKSSNGTALVGLTVTAAATTTGLSLSASTVTYGNETTEVFSATVASSAGTPTGTVTVGSSAGTLCQITLASGSGSCHLTPTQLAVGSVKNVVATYGGSGNFAGSSSAPALSFTVSKDTTTTKISESPTTVTPGDESAAIFTVAVTTGQGEAVPNNETVKVTVGSTSCTVALTAGTGTCKIGNSALAVGSYVVSAAYGGDANLGSSSGTSATKLTV